MHTLKIVQIIQKPQFRGAELFACQLSNHLISQGHQVLMICLYKGTVTLPFNGPIIYLQRPENKRFFDFTGWKKFSKIIKNFHPDVIQANAADTLKFAASSKFLFHIPVPIIFRNANKIGDFMNLPVKKIINKLYLSQVSMVLSVSKLCRKDFINTFNFPRNKVKTIEIGVEEHSVNVSNFNLDHIENKKVVVHVGSFVPEKNHSGLLRIFTRVLKTYPDAVLLLIGKGDLEQQIREEVKKENLIPNVFFLGYRDDVLEIFKKSDCFVLPSLIEGLPGVLLEAMYCKLPVVTYDVGGISEIISQETGSLVGKNNEDEFVKEICGILDSRDDRKIQQAYSLVKKKYINDRIAKRFARSYQKIIIQNTNYNSNGLHMRKNQKSQLI